MPHPAFSRGKKGMGASSATLIAPISNASKMRRVVEESDLKPPDRSREVHGSELRPLDDAGAVDEEPQLHAFDAGRFSERHDVERTDLRASNLRREVEASDLRPADPSRDVCVDKSELRPLDDVGVVPEDPQLHAFDVTLLAPPVGPTFPVNGCGLVDESQLKPPHRELDAIVGNAELNALKGPRGRE